MLWGVVDNHGACLRTTKTNGSYLLGYRMFDVMLTLLSTISLYYCGIRCNHIIPIVTQNSVLVHWASLNCAMKPERMDDFSR